MFELERLKVKPSAPAIPLERPTHEDACMNCGHDYYDHLVSMHTAQTGECRLCVCREPETARKDDLWDEIKRLRQLV